MVERRSMRSMTSAAARDTRAESSTNSLTADVAATDKTSVRRVPRHQRVRTSPACILTWVRRGWSTGPGPGAWANARSGSRRLVRGNPPLKSLVNPAAGSAFVAAEWPRRLSVSGSEPPLGATRYRNLSWCSDLVGERLSVVANALTMENQRSRSLDKASDRA